MDESLHNEALLISYLDGKLTGEEKRGLEERLKTDEVLQEQLAGLNLAVQAIRLYGTTEKVAYVHREIMGELKRRPKSKVISMDKIVRYALAVASVFLVYIGVKFYMATQVSPEKIYSQVFVDFTTAASRGGGEDVSMIEKAYQQKNYEAVIQRTRSLPLDAKDSLLIGLSYLQTERPSNAIAFFMPITRSKNEYYEDAEFYLSLSHLRNREYAKALLIMRMIAANPSHLYHKQLPDEVLKKVEKMME